MTLAQYLQKKLSAAAYARLIDHYGGENVWVPTRGEAVWLPGIDIPDAYRGDYWHVPKRTRTVDDIRQRIAQLHRDGSHKIDEIAAMVGCSRRTVFRHLAAKIS